jgi:hypothetical protein
MLLLARLYLPLQIGLLLILNGWVSHTVSLVQQMRKQFILQPAIPDRVREAQQRDRLLQQVRACILEGRTVESTIDGNGAVRFHGRLCVPQRYQVKDISREAHRTPYTVHPRETKMYQDPNKNLLVENNESGCGQVCVILWHCHGFCCLLMIGQRCPIFR